MTPTLILPLPGGGKSSYPQLLSSMMDSILAGDLAPARTLYRDKANFPQEAQLAVYVDGYRLRLREVVENTYPALLYYLGRPVFQALADSYVATTRSQHFNIDRYSTGFAAHVARESRDGFAGELAALESAIHETYHGEESPAMERSWVEAQTPDSLTGAILLLRVASRLLAFDYAANAYLTAFREESAPQKPQKEKTHLLVFRHRNQVQRMELEAAEYALLSLLAEGKTLAASFEDERFAVYANDDAISEKLMHWFGKWVREGALRNP